MNDKELGHLRFVVKIANAEIDDFDLIPYSNSIATGKGGNTQASMSSYRYALAFMTYFLALEQFHKIPAWTDFLQAKFDRLIIKMQHKKVWDYWAEASKGTPPYEPNMDRPYPSERDPVRIKNIMYSGHLAQMISLYEKLYVDLKWGQPNSIQFKWNEKEIYYYDTHKLHKLIYDAFMNQVNHCIECHQNTCFPVCNQHPILALRVYDDIYGTKYFEKASVLLLDWYTENNLIDPDDHTVASMHLIKQDSVIGRNNVEFDNLIEKFLKPLSVAKMIRLHGAALDGWNGAFMNAWAPDLVKEHYPYQVKNSVKIKNKTMAYTKREGIYDQLAAPFFAMLAAEMGDIELRDKLMNWADWKFKAEWTKDGSFFYPSGAEILAPVLPRFRYKGISLSGKIAAMARANVKDGIRKTAPEEFAGLDELSPRLAGVDYAKLNISRAIFDKKKKAFIITSVSAEGANDSSEFQIENLNPKVNGSYT